MKQKEIQVKLISSVRSCQVSFGCAKKTMEYYKICTCSPPSFQRYTAYSKSTQKPTIVIRRDLFQGILHSDKKKVMGKAVSGESMPL